MTGEQQHRHLLTLVKNLAQRAHWPEMPSPTGKQIKGAVQWGDELRALERQRNMWAVSALETLADKLHEIEKNGSNPAMQHGFTVRDAVSTSGQADTEPILSPSAREFATFVRAAAAARRHGIRLHPDLIQVVWFDRSVDGNEAPGSFDSRDFVIYLQRGLSEMELFRTVVHELQHADDRVALGQKYYALGRAEQERRADAAEYQVCWAEGFAVDL